MKNGEKYLTDIQKDQIRTWIRSGYTAPQIEELAKRHGFVVSSSNIYNNYLPQVKKEWREHIEKGNTLSATWFAKEYRAEKAAQIADMLFNDIMEGKMYGEEVTEKEDGRRGLTVTRKPLYFAGMIKNWKDLVDTIATELGQRKNTVDVNFNKNQNLNLSVLVEKIYEEDDKVDKQIEGAEIIDLPSGEDFADEKGFMAIVGDQPEEIKQLVEAADNDGDVL